MGELQSKQEVYTFLKHSLEKSKAQDTALEVVLNRMEMIEGNVLEVRDEVVQHKDEVIESLNDMKNRITIDYECQRKLQSINAKKSYAVAKEHYEDTEEHGAEIRELAGYATRHQWKMFKKYFSVTRYTSLKQVNFEQGKIFLIGVSLGNEFIKDFYNWKKQRAKKLERELKSARQG